LFETHDRYQFENTYFTEMCSDSEAGSYLRLTDFVYHSILGLRVIKKKRRLTNVDGIITSSCNTARSPNVGGNGGGVVCVKGFAFGCRI